MAVVLRLLGEVTAEVDGLPVDLGPARQRCVLAALAVDADRVVSVDLLVERVWGGDVARRAQSTLHSYISRIRRVLAGAGGVAIVRRSSGYALTTDVTGSVVDLHRFRDLRAAADAEPDDEQAARLLTEALDLWRGEALTGVNGDWSQVERDRLTREQQVTRHDLADVRLRLGHGGKVVVELAEQAGAHPLDERVQGQYMLALHQVGRTAEALEHYHQVRARLVEELGTDPGAALRELHQRLLTADAPAGGVTAAVVPRQLPAAPALFTGRVAELAELDRVHGCSATGGGGMAVISAIGGTGGIGKTWLALTWANRALHHFPDGQLFADLRGFSAGDPRQATDVLAGFLTALGVDHQPQTPDARAALYRTHTAGKRMLVLLDNAATHDQVAPLLPGGTSCTVLITSRHRLPAVLTRHGARPVHLDVLADAEARALLGAAIGEGTTDRRHSQITELIGLCRGFPLALGLIAARVRGHPHLVDDIVADLRDLGLDALDSDDPDASLPTVLSWSLRHLTDRQRTLFGLLGIAPGPDTTPAAAAALAGLDPAAARKALSALEEAFLLERRPRGRFGMHDLVRDYAGTTAHGLPDGVREAALERVVDFHLRTAFAADRLLSPHRQFLHPGLPAEGVQALPLSDATAAMAWLEAEHATLLATQRVAATLGRHLVVWHLAWSLDTFHVRRGHRGDAIAVWRAAVDAAAHLPDPATRSRAHRLLGNACSRSGRHDEAAEHLDQALALALRHDDSFEQARTHTTFAFACGRQGDDRRALDHARRAVDLYRTLDDPVWEADALNMMGWFAAHLGDFDAARAHCHAALALQRRHHDPEGEADTLNSLGLIAHRTGDHRQAVDHHHRALTLHRALGDAYEIASNLDRIGHPHAALGHHDRARAVWQEALGLFREQGRGTDAERVRRQLDDLDRPSR
ncbi:BTAD domain-containing putative transcriptional regulator [Umezawaea endophytica]|uniref:Tetratricopeptide repeat protein n=1 Tax=Umezawaea endophytica TaxID=1654476 RepID=A0A9X2ZZ43_9PSEU|nr:BTAD domain-containing putative transcriptional regulator [Umezawaea endophytica]MCS7477029.1 tetratricopeptide repeat protein [Umezawaea endophytica]